MGVSPHAQLRSQALFIVTQRIVNFNFRKVLLALGTSLFNQLFQVLVWEHSTHGKPKK